MDNNLDIFKEVIQKPSVVILKKDLRKAAKEYKITKKNLIKKLNRSGYEYDRKAKGYIYLESNTEGLRMDGITSDYNIKNIEKLCEINMLLLEKLNNSNTQIKEKETDIIEADIKIIANYNKEDFEPKTIRLHKGVWAEFQANHKANHKHLTQQELHARALEEFNKKYNY